MRYGRRDDPTAYSAALCQHPDRQGREWGGRGALDKRSAPSVPSASRSRSNTHPDVELDPPCRSALVNDDAIRSCASGTEGSTARVSLPPPSRMGRACRSIKSAAYTRVRLDNDALWDMQRQTQRRIPLSDNASPAANR